MNGVASKTKQTSAAARREGMNGITGTRTDTVGPNKQPQPKRAGMKEQLSRRETKQTAAAVRRAGMNGLM